MGNLLVSLRVLFDSDEAIPETADILSTSAVHVRLLLTMSHICSYLSVEDRKSVSRTCIELKDIEACMPIDFKNSEIFNFFLRGDRHQPTTSEVITISRFDITLDFCKEIKPPLCIAPATPKGMGLFARRTIALGSQVVRYNGEMLSSAEAARRYSHSYDSQKLNYILTIKELIPQGESPPLALVTNVDGTIRGGIARYINHSCEPNLIVCMDRNVAIDESIIPAKTRQLIGIPTFVAIRTIAPGEELSFDYGATDTSIIEERMEARRSRKVGKWGEQHKDVSTASESRSSTAMPCYCGAKNCKKWLFALNLKNE